MAKFTILLIALLFIAHTCCASKWQKHEQESCSDQLENINLKKCAKHIMERIQDEDDDDETNVITTVRGRINYIKKGQGEDDMQKYCCNELDELTSHSCKCRALQKIMEKQSDRLEDNEKKEMEKELMRVARKCGLGPMMGCDLSPQED